eukprot:Selendium_serpulae@DN6386_c3_g1_i7.p1
MVNIDARSASRSWSFLDAEMMYLRFFSYLMILGPDWVIRLAYALHPARPKLSWYAFLLTPDGYQEPSDCPSDKMLIALDLNTYVATPPYFTYRYAEGTTSVRSGLTSRSGNTTCSNIYS